MKFKRNWRNPDWIVKSMVYSPLSREELEALKNYWFYRWNFLEDSDRNKNAYEKPCGVIDTVGLFILTENLSCI